MRLLNRRMVPCPALRAPSLKAVHAGLNSHENRPMRQVGPLLHMSCQAGTFEVRLDRSVDYRGHIRPHAAHWPVIATEIKMPATADPPEVQKTQTCAGASGPHSARKPQYVMHPFPSL
jgi:hypothetical protein